MLSRQTDINYQSDTINYNRQTLPGQTDTIKTDRHYQEQTDTIRTDRHYQEQTDTTRTDRQYQEQTDTIRTDRHLTCNITQTGSTIHHPVSQLKFIF